MSGQALLESAQNQYDSEPDEDAWPSGELGSNLCSLEKVFTCSICKDFMTNPQILPCQHCYCMECINRCMDIVLWQNARKECPTCRKDCNPSQCKPNVPLSIAISAFKGARKALLEVLHRKDSENTIVYVTEDSRNKAPLDNDLLHEEASSRRSGRKRKSRIIINENDDDTADNMSFQPPIREEIDLDGIDEPAAVQSFDSNRKLIDSRSNSASDQAFADTTLTSILSLSRERGVEITRRITPYNFQIKGQGGTKKIIEQLRALASGSRILPRLDGDEKKLKDRYRDLVHGINAQVGAAVGLTLDEVIRRCTAAETAAEKAAKTEAKSRMTLESMTGSHPGFKKMIAEMRRKQAIHAEVPEKQAHDAVSDCTHDGLNHAAADDLAVLHQTTDVSVSQPNQPNETVNRSSRAGAQMSTHTTPVVAATSANHDPEIVLGAWRVLLSEKLQQPFFYHIETGVGQFALPADITREMLTQALGTENPASRPAAVIMPAPVCESPMQLSALSKHPATHASDLTQRSSGVNNSQPAPNQSQSIKQEEQSAQDGDSSGSLSPIISLSASLKSDTNAGLSQTSVAPSHQAVWHCVICTLVNEVNADCCAACETPNPQAVRKKTRSAGTSQMLLSQTMGTTKPAATSVVRSKNRSR